VRSEFEYSPFGAHNVVRSSELVESFIRIVPSNTCRVRELESKPFVVLKSGGRLAQQRGLTNLHHAQHHSSSMDLTRASIENNAIPITMLEAGFI
jgi:hypothetical protein